MHENVLSRKIETTTPYMSMNMHFNMTKGSYFTQIYKNDLVNDHTEQKVSSSDGSGNNLNRYRSYDFKPLHAENTSKRFSMNEQTAFDIAPNIIKSGFMDTTNRGYAAKNFISPFSKKPAGVGQNSFTSFVSDQYDVMRTQTSHTKRADSFNCKLSMTTIPLRISNEHSRSGRYNSQDWIVSGHEYMKRLLQAHQVVDELLKARGLISNNEVDYLYSWDQKMNREPKTKEQNILDVYGPVACKNAGGLDISGVSQLRSTSMSLGGDSENDSRDSPKLQERNSQNFMFTVLTSEKQGTGSIESVKVNIVKTKEHMDVYLKLIIKKPQHCWLYMDVKIRLKKKEAVSEKTHGSATTDSKKGCNKGWKMVDDQTQQTKNRNQVHISAKSSEINSCNQNKRLNWDHKMALEQSASTRVQKLSTTKSTERQMGKKHNAFLSKPKCETVDVCCCFVNKHCCPHKAIISLSVARCATVKQKNITVDGKEFLNKAEKETKLKCNEGDSVGTFLVAKTAKLPFHLNMLQNMEKNKIIAAQKGDKVIESNGNMMEVEKDILDLSKTKKHFKFPIPTKASRKKLKGLEGSTTLFSVLHTKKLASDQTRETSASSKQATVSKNLCLQSKLPQLETAVRVPVRSHKISITKQVVVKQITDSMKHQHEILMKVNKPSVLKKKECFEVEKAQKALQNYTTTKGYQEILRSITKSESNVITEFEHNADTDIRRAREHLKRINFDRTGVSMESSTSFVHRINNDPLNSEQSFSALSVVKKKEEKVFETKIDKDSKNRPIQTPKPTTSTEQERYHDGGTTTERNSDILDKELINAYRRTQRIPKPQAKIPAWNDYDEQKQTTDNKRNPPKLRHGTLSTASPLPCFIRARTPTLIDAAVTLSTVIPTTAVLRHVPSNHLPAVNSRLKNVSSSGSSITTTGSLQQHSPSSQFGVTLKRVDRAIVKKSKSRGAITQSAPKKPWVPKWRRIQRTEEEEETETIPIIEVNKDEHRSDSDEEQKQIPIRFSSQAITEENGRDMTEAEKAMMVAKRRQIEEESTKLQKYEEKRQVEREREEEELRKLKEKKERRKLEREEEERQLQERLTQKERKRKQEEEERKAKIEAEKLKKDNERRKRQQMLSSQFTNMALGQIRRNFVLPEKSDRTDKFGNIVQAKQEMSMTKEQQEEAKRNYLVYVKHTMEFGKNGPKELREKIRQIHQRICKLEADKYDLEKRHERQEYDLRELNERQRQVARNKAFKKGLHPADTNSIHPPKVSIISKYDRQIDRRNFRERRAMFENKTAYPCFPNVLPPPTLYEKIILCDDKPDEPEDEDDEVDEEEEEGDEEEE
ncbi:Uncharacterized protein BM_BM2203 [Brugia malayi]|uniref:Bm2203, isoform c n=1 Tax=Brugia malayi TaxID=6279 RepID=A0A4E9ETK3_BRUMA|nr:Uncharacterized protein BM_BM2203 [Brugia malayi]VIO86863.1 Uncharacterized protein BM_BM2203 [Brugia malayi]